MNKKEQRLRKAIDRRIKDFDECNNQIKLSINGSDIQNSLIQKRSSIAKDIYCSAINLGIQENYIALDFLGFLISKKKE